MKRGFSLVEMMIALALTAVAIAIMSEGVRRAIDFEQRLTTVRQERELQAATLEAVRARLERMVTATRPSSTSEEDNAETLFAGDRHRLVFVAADPGYPSIAGLYEYRLILSGASVTDAESGNAAPLLTIFRRRIIDLATFNTDRGEPAQSWELPLPREMEFCFAGHSGNESETWSDSANFPALVMLSADEVGFASLTVALPRPAPNREEAPE
jgi:prepilin-type N-terminal cleavage/methylation domain-containing protein